MEISNIPKVHKVCFNTLCLIEYVQPPITKLIGILSYIILDTYTQIHSYKTQNITILLIHEELSNNNPKHPERFLVSCVILVRPSDLPRGALNIA